MLLFFLYKKHFHSLLANAMKKSVILFFFIISTVSCKNEIKEKEGMILIKGGTYEMGGDNIQARADEFPKHTVEISSFWMDKTTVTNAQFKKFIDATQYITTAENDFDYTNENGESVHQKAGAFQARHRSPPALPEHLQRLKQLFQSCSAVIALQGREPTLHLPV